MVAVTVPPGVIERIVEVLDPEEVWLFADGRHDDWKASTALRFL